jgi:flagellar biogenesis protein FliO
LTLFDLASWLLTGRFTAAAPGTTEFLGDALSAIEDGARTTQEPSTLALFFGILWKLALVVVLIFATVWVLKRIMRGGMLPMTTENGIRVLSVVHLSARHSIYLIELGERLLVVGAGSESLSLLADISSPTERAAIREQLRESGGRFGSYIAAWASRMRGGGPREQLREGSDFLKRSLDQFRRRAGGEGEESE